MSFKDYFGISDSLLPRIATGFGGGIGRKGSICGALSGAVMAIGMKSGRTDPKDKDALSRTYEKCQRLWERFGKEFGSQNCFSLIGYHLDNPDELKQWQATGGREKCGEIISKTARMLCDFIQDE